MDAPARPMPLPAPVTRTTCPSTRPTVAPVLVARRPTLPSPVVRAVVQRVTSASVAVAGEIVGSIGAGLCVFVGVTHTDDADGADRLADKLWHLRIFEDETGKANRSAADLALEVL